MYTKTFVCAELWLLGERVKTNKSNQLEEIRKSTATGKEKKKSPINCYLSTLYEINVDRKKSGVLLTFFSGQFSARCCVSSFVIDLFFSCVLPSHIAPNMTIFLLYRFRVVCTFSTGSFDTLEVGVK